MAHGRVLRGLLLLGAVGLPLSGSEPAAALPGTEILRETRDWKRVTVDQIDAFLQRQAATMRAERSRFWQRDFSSAAAYAQSVEPNRARLRERLGIVDRRVDAPDLDYRGGPARPPLRAETDAYCVYAVSWPVLSGMSAEGLLLVPKGKITAGVVAIPDADQTPESLAGLMPGTADTSQFPRILAERGAVVLIPTLIDRRDLWSGDDRLNKYTDISHREWIYRQAAVVGRHIIGYEVQKVLAAVDWLRRPNAITGDSPVPTGIFGYGEGGMIALYSAALDPRIDAACVSGYFSPRDEIWTEPLYRNVWRLLEEFGDAEVATLVAPRALIVEHSVAPEVRHPGKPSHSGKTLDRATSAAAGRLTTPPYLAARMEWERALALIAPAWRGRWNWIDAQGRGPVTFGSPAAVAAFLQALGVTTNAPSQPQPFLSRAPFTAGDSEKRQHRQFLEMQELGRRSEYARGEFFWRGLASIRSPDAWSAATARLRETFWNDFIGRLPVPHGNLNPRSRVLPGFENDRWSAHELIIDVWPEVQGWAYLLLPKNLRPGERRPVVVCQHGAAGAPVNVISRAGQPGFSPTLHGFGADLADRGFIVLATNMPNMVVGQPYLALQRKANPLGKSLFSVITAIHQRYLEWLGGQPFVDPQRIAFYGLSYGGKAAVRVPALLEGYCLSICSGDWNDYVPKMISVRRDKNTFMFTASHDTIEFNLANTFSYAEMAALIAPRPFMVENGYQDLVMPVEWASAEYGKVRKMYFLLGIPERTEMDYFDGPHTVHGGATFKFLHRHLNWPEPSAE